MNYDDLEIDDLIKDLQRDFLSDKDSDSVADSLESILDEYTASMEESSAVEAPVEAIEAPLVAEASVEDALAEEENTASAEDDFLAQFAGGLGLEIGDALSSNPAEEASEAPGEVAFDDVDAGNAATETAVLTEAVRLEEDGLPELDGGDLLPEGEDEAEEKQPLLANLKALLPKKKQQEKQKSKPKKAKQKAKVEDDEEEETESFPAYVTVLHDIVFMMAAIMLVFVFVVRLVGVKGSSMVPTYSDGDRVVLLSNFISDDYKQGDVVVLIAPDYDESTPLIKRVIATEGQTININFASGKVYVDNELLDEDYINDITTYNPGGMNYPVEVPKGCVFVMGDNRNHSTDSRNAKVGFVNKDEVLGKVVFRLFHSKASSGAVDE